MGMNPKAMLDLGNHCRVCITIHKNEGWFTSFALKKVKQCG